MQLQVQMQMQMQVQLQMQLQIQSNQRKDSSKCLTQMTDNTRSKLHLWHTNWMHCYKTQLSTYWFMLRGKSSIVSIEGKFN